MVPTLTTVHPMEGPPSQPGDAAMNQMPRRRLDDIPGMSGTRLGLALRLSQFALALIALCIFTIGVKKILWNYILRWYLAAIGFQSLWGLSLGIADLYAILAKRSIRNRKAIIVFTIVDWISSTMTFAAACASLSSTWNFPLQPPRFQKRAHASISIAFLSWCTTLPSFVFNVWILASKQNR